MILSICEHSGVDIEVCSVKGSLKYIGKMEFLKLK